MPLLTSCPSGWTPEPMPNSAYVPVLMSRQQLEVSVNKKGPQMITSPGKLYRYGHYILINEQYKGVHIINNQDPRAPQNVGFIQVPGSLDFAMKNNVMYVDNAVDMVAINLSDPDNPQISKRIQNAFPALLPPDRLPVVNDEKGMPQDAIIVGWKLKEE